MSKDPIAAALGARGGAKGGPARAKALSPEKRREIARKAAQKRWAKLRAEKGGEAPAPSKLDNTPMAVDRGTIAAGDKRLEWYILDDGRKLIGSLSIKALLGDSAGVTLDGMLHPDEAAEDFRLHLEIVAFRLPGNWQVMRGVPPNMLVDLVRAILRRRSGHPPDKTLVDFLADLAVLGLNSQIQAST